MLRSLIAVMKVGHWDASQVDSLDQTARLALYVLERVLNVGVREPTGKTIVLTNFRMWSGRSTTEWFFSRVTSTEGPQAQARSLCDHQANTQPVSSLEPCHSYLNTQFSSLSLSSVLSLGSQSRLSFSLCSRAIYPARRHVTGVTVLALRSFKCPLLWTSTECSTRKRENADEELSNYNVPGFSWLWHDLTTMASYDFELVHADRSSYAGASVNA